MIFTCLLLALPVPGIIGAMEEDQPITDTFRKDPSVVAASTIAVKRKRYVAGDNTTLSGDTVPLAIGDSVALWLKRREQHGGDDGYPAKVISVNDRTAPYGQCLLFCFVFVALYKLKSLCKLCQCGSGLH